jgi:hypothetical protein
VLNKRGSIILIGWLIVACEVGFWLFILFGLFTRYVLNKKKLGLFFLYCTPLVDLILLLATVIDLRNGSSASAFHGLAAVYIGVSIGYGHRMIKWADERFANRFADREKPVKKKLYGREHARVEREGWFRHFISWLIGGLLLLGIIFLIDNKSQTTVLLQTLRLWSIILVIDFLISFSYTIFPKKAKGTE